MYELVEIFESLQGEGRNTGRPCVFVRFAGCNLKCPWCDTDVTKRFSASLDELLAELGQYKAKSVILTGGEPTMQKEMPELVAALKKAGYWIGVETNGTNDADWLGFVDYVACSPKRGASVRLVEADEVRVVAEDEATADFCRKVRRQPRPTTTFRRAIMTDRLTLRRRSRSFRSSPVGRSRCSCTRFWDSDKRE